MNFEELKPFDLTGIKPFFPDQSEEAKCAAVMLPESLRIARESEKHEVLNGLHLSNAVAHIKTLPGPRETLHCVTKGNYNSSDIIPATLELAGGATIKRLDLATLSFSNRNVSQIAELKDAGKIAEIWLLYSSYFAQGNEEQHRFAEEHLAKARGARIGSVRCHAKIILMEMSDDRHFVVESSANLRSCHNIEQFTFCNSREVLLFYRDWIEKLVKHAEGTKTAGSGE